MDEAEYTSLAAALAAVPDPRHRRGQAIDGKAVRGARPRAGRAPGRAGAA